MTSIARLFLPLIAAASLAAAAAERRETPAVSGFDAVALSAPVHLVVQQGEAEGLVLEGDEADLAEIESVVERGTLVIRLRERLRSVTFKSKVHGVVNLRAVRALSVSGSGDITASALRGAALHAAISGSGDLRIGTLAYSDVELSVSGSGTVTVGGKADNVAAHIAGSGDVKAGTLESRDARVSIAGSGDAIVWARQNLKVSIAGSGGVRYYGDPSLKTSIAGSGNVRRAGTAPS